MIGGDYCALCRRALEEQPQREHSLCYEHWRTYGGAIRRGGQEKRIFEMLLALRTFKETFAGMRAIAVELQLLGVGELSLAFAKAWRITITSPTPTTILVNAPFTGTSLRAAKRIYGRVATYEKLSDGGKKFIGNAWPISQQAAVWQFLQNEYPGAECIGRKGAFMIPDRETDANGATLVATVTERAEPLADASDLHPSAEEIERQEVERERRKEAMTEDDAMERRAEERMARARGEFE